MFVPDGAGGARFVPLPAPTDDDDAAICARVVRRIQRLPAVSLIHSCGRVGYVAITSATDACDGATVQFGLRRPAA